MTTSLNTLAPTSTTSGTQKAAALTSATQQSLAETQEQFLTLLVSQMKYQDPMNPMDNAQMTSQIAQLNTVSGINQLNTSVQGLADQLGAMQSLQASSLLGRSALVAGESVELVEGFTEFAADLESPVSDLKVTIRDAAGKVVFEQAMGPQESGLVGLVWDGKTTAGEASPDGNYRVSLTATEAGTTRSVEPLVMAEIRSVSLNGGETLLGFGALGERPLSSIDRLM